MAAALASGKWELEKSENFDEYMKAIGVGIAQRLIGNQMKPRQEISIADGVWTIVTTSAFGKVEITFRIGEEFEETTADGRKVKTVVTMDGNRVVQDQKGKVNSVLTRDFSEDSFVMTLEAEGVISKRYYKRVN